MTTAVLACALTAKSRFGGSLWVRWSWAEALQRLGFDVLILDELGPGGDTAAFDETVARLGVPGALLSGTGIHGLDEAELHDRLDDAALLVNLGGHLRRTDLLRRPRTKVFVDLDPGYTQIWHANGQDVGLKGHDHYFTIGTNIGTPSCPIPTGGLRWHGVRQPVVLDRWPVRSGGFNGFSTVASWRGAFGTVTWNGRTYGPKAHQFRRFVDLPRTTALPFTVVLDIHAEDEPDRTQLTRFGWSVQNRDSVARPDDFAEFVSGSGAEFSPAQDVYVSTRSGWFSDRTVRYLASGRPAVVQDTGCLSVPTGSGLLTFRTADDAARAAGAIVADYDAHREAARELAEQYFAHERALAPLLDVTGVTP
jgi:hypothetical protein